MASLAVTLAWVVVVRALGIVLVQGEGARADWRAAVVNALALLIPLALVSRWGWWERAGLTPLRPWRLRPLVPLAAVAVLPLAFGVDSLGPADLAAAVALYAMLGVNEELTFRGVVQGVWLDRPALVQCVAVGLIFGLQHASNVLAGQPVGETAAQVGSNLAFGLAYAAVRLRVWSIWPLAALHAVDDLDLRLAAGVPAWWHLLVAIALTAYGVGLARSSQSAATNASAAARTLEGSSPHELGGRGVVG